MNISIINGPNLNLLGVRETDIYGFSNFEVYLKTLKDKFSQINFDYFQSNIEGEIIDRLHHVGFESDGIILNAAAYTHTSVGIGDAVKGIKTKVIEVHISNIYKREEFRHKSLLSAVVNGGIFGLGSDCYILAINAMQNLIKNGN